MRINWPPRALWLPALAVLLPCAFIGVLGYQWLALEREAEAHRGADAARSVVGALRRDLSAHLRDLAEATAGTLAGLPGNRPPFQVAPPLPSILSSAWLFDASGTLVAPDDEAEYERAVESFEAATSEPVWQRAFASAQDLEHNGQIAAAVAAARDLLPRSTTPSLQAAVLLTLGRLSLLSGQLVDAEQFARRIGDCCPGARDEFGLSRSFS